MKLLKSFLVLSFVATLFAQPVFAGPAISVLGGVNKSLADSVSGSVLGVDFTTSPTLGFQGGLEFGFGLSPKVQLDVGALYVAYKSKSEVAGRSTTESTNFINIPVQFRLKLGNMFSIGAGGFYDLAMTDGADGDYGYVGSLRFMFGPSFFVDGRYLGGLKSPDGGGDKSKAWMANVGFSFGGKK